MRHKNNVWFAILGLPGLGAKDTWLARTTRFVGVLAGIACPLLMLGIARADYDFSQIDAGGVNGTYLLAINTLEQYVGVTVDETFHNHGVTSGDQFDVPGATDTFVSGINDAGRFVGYYYDGPHSHGFLWDGFGLTQIDVPGESDTQANGINNANQIAGIAGRGYFSTDPLPALNSATFVHLGGSVFDDRVSSSTSKRFVERGSTKTPQAAVSWAFPGSGRGSSARSTASKSTSSPTKPA